MKENKNILQREFNSHFNMNTASR